MGPLVFGTVAFDTLDFPGRRLERIPGGSGTHSALAMALFTPPRLIALVGRDFPQAYLDQFRDRGCDLAGVGRDTTRDTFHWAARYSADGNHRQTTALELNCLADYHPVVPAEARDASFALLSAMPPAMQLEILDQLAPACRTLIDTVQDWIDRHQDDLERVMQRAAMLIMNDDEARSLTGIDNVYKAARDIARRTTEKTVIVKRGEHGSFLVKADSISLFPAYPVEEVRDPTGAGDSFAGAFLGCLSAGVGMPHAMVAGTLMASFNVESDGPAGPRCTTPFARHFEILRWHASALSWQSKFRRVFVAKCWPCSRLLSRPG
jgi:sugar/nucleoside kinase (ribokinase family)